MAKFISTQHKNKGGKKAQIWGFDLMIAITIFLVGIIIIYIYAINITSESESTLNTLMAEGNLLSSLILSEGGPKNWPSAPESEIEIPGILTRNKINETKLNRLQSLSYTEQKKLLGTNNEFFLNFEAITIGNSPSEEKNLVRIERFSIYENKPVKLTFYIWN